MALVAAVVLAGGRSSRMGTPKADLEWHGSTLLRHVVGLAGRNADAGVVVVRAPGQPLPELPASVQVVEDPEPDRGPLQGLAAGLSVLEPQVDAAFVCSTDLPFLHPAFVRRVCSALGDADVALPVVGGFRQPLAAAYRTSLGTRAAELLGAGQSRVAALLEGAAVEVLDESALLADDRLRAADPHLASVEGVNDRPAYDRARAAPAPEVRVQRVGVLALGDGPATAAVRAATVGAAAQACGLVLDRHLLAAVDGDAVGRDAATPLAQGDVVTFLSADAGG